VLESAGSKASKRGIFPQTMVRLEFGAENGV